MEHLGFSYATLPFQGRLQSYQLAVKEVDAQFNETIYIDKDGNYEIIKVPKHRYLSGVTIFHDFKKVC